ncbi:MAG: hypothetical protein KDA28_02865, partial [Phycisphaerales bacterium]|nr:hypothetical protein [Phycisphaerales bacterium]
MERASQALARTDVFEAADLCETALRRAHQRRDFERLARICLPLQEARRAIRLEALEASGAHVHDRRPKEIEPGRHLVQPPLLGIDGTRLQQNALRRRVAALVVTREPMTLDGRWPVVAVGETSFRARVAPPVPGRRVEGTPTWDEPLEG